MNTNQVKHIIFDFWGVIFNPATQEPMPGLEEFLESLTVTCGIASSSPKETIQEFLEQNHLEQYFKTIVGYYEVELTKPDPECYLKVAKFFKADPEDCLVIDDSAAAIEAASATGFQTVFFGNTVHSFDELITSELLS